MKAKSKKEGAAALMHVVMLGSSEGDQVMIGAMTPTALQKAVTGLVGRAVADEEISRVAVCDAALAGLWQTTGSGQ